MIRELTALAESLFEENKGLLAMDESNPTCNRRFAALGIPQTPEFRRKYRELIVTAPALSESISGAILFDETVRQTLSDGTPFVEAMIGLGIVPGIKVDAGAVEMPKFPGEKVTEGLDGLRRRLAEYSGLGLKFAKWRAVIAVGDGLPTDGCIHANAEALARYAALCQEVGLVPIVEPEVLMDGDHSLEQCALATHRTLQTVFNALDRERVDLEAMILKPNMVLPGRAAAEQGSVDSAADATLRCLLECVPAAVPAVAFLSGGQPADLASARLNAMNVRYRAEAPWAIAFSYSRAIQQPALDIWRGDDANVGAAQRALVHRAQCNRAAREGAYTSDMESG